MADDRRHRDDPGDSATWAGIVAAWFREPSLTRLGASRRLVLAIGVAALLVSLIVIEATRAGGFWTFVLGLAAVSLLSFLAVTEPSGDV
jgi:hypothetical protein